MLLEEINITSGFCWFQVGILVTCEDLYTDRQWKVCHAFATFVARRTEAGKVRRTYWHKIFFTRAAWTSVGFVVCFCAYRYSWSRWLLTRKWSRWNTAWLRSGGGWGWSTLRSLQTYWAAAPPSWVRAGDAGLCSAALGCAIRLIKAPCFFLHPHQENARNIRTLCQPKERESRVWSWCFRHMQTTKSAPLGARSWPGWRMWPPLLQGVDLDCSGVTLA